MRYFVLLACLCLCAVAACAEDSFPELEALIPPESGTATRVDVAFSEETESILRRFQAAMQKQPEWWMQYVKKHADDRPLPYHSNFEITEEEYRKALSPETATLVELGETAFGILVLKDGRTRIEIEGTPEELAYIDIAPSGKKCTTPFGTMVGVEKKELDAKGTLGPWQGYSWREEEGSFDAGEYRSQMVSLGRIISSGRIFVSIRQTLVQNHVTTVKNRLYFILQVNPEQGVAPDVEQRPSWPIVLAGCVGVVGVFLGIWRFLRRRT